MLEFDFGTCNRFDSLCNLPIYITKIWREKDGAEQFLGISSSPSKFCKTKVINEVRNGLTALLVCQNLTVLCCAQHMHTTKHTQHSSNQHNGNSIFIIISLCSPHGFLSKRHLELLVCSGKFQNLHWHVVLRVSNDWRVSATCRPIPAHPLVNRLRLVTKLKPHPQFYGFSYRN